MTREQATKNIAEAMKATARHLNPHWETFHEQDWLDLADAALRTMNRQKRRWVGAA